MQRTNKVPSYLICSITQSIFLEPVTVTPSGHVYEKEALDKIVALAVAENKTPLCPVSRLEIKETSKAWGIMSAVEDYLENHPEAKAEQYVRENSSAAVNHATVAIVQPPAPTSVNQIQEDERQARALQQQEEMSIQAELEAAAREVRQMEVRRRQEAENEIRESNARLVEEHRRQREASERLERSLQRYNDEQEARKPYVSVKNDKERATLLNDIQNLIYALEFEIGPKPRGSIQNDSLVFFAVIESMFLKPLPWQKIIVNKDGPYLNGMYDVLKAAKKALEEVNPDILVKAKQDAEGEYDRVKTTLAGEKTLSKGGYANFARFMGTIKNQPGYHVDQMLIRVEHLLRDICKHNVEIKERAKVMRR